MRRVRRSRQVCGASSAEARREWATARRSPRSCGRLAYPRPERDQRAAPEGHGRKGIRRADFRPGTRRARTEKNIKRWTQEKRPSFFSRMSFSSKASPGRLSSEPNRLRGGAKGKVWKTARGGRDSRLARRYPGEARYRMEQGRGGGATETRAKRPGGPQTYRRRGVAASCGPMVRRVRGSPPAPSSAPLGAQRGPEPANGGRSGAAYLGQSPGASARGARPAIWGALADSGGPTPPKRCRAGALGSRWARRRRGAGRWLGGWRGGFLRRIWGVSKSVDGLLTNSGLKSAIMRQNCPSPENGYIL